MKKMRERRKKMRMERGREREKLVTVTRSDCHRIQTCSLLFMLYSDRILSWFTYLQAESSSWWVVAKANSSDCVTDLIKARHSSNSWMEQFVRPSPLTGKERRNEERRNEERKIDEKEKMRRNRGKKGKE